ncbi:MAG: DNA polymerase domain-containing protein, partial [Heliobacteriaceae bacterium]|nr:DNA polymerase domain-containing protein [Heliobacteriaceae bacterium]
RTIAYCRVEDLADLLYLINLGVIEIHPWLSRAGSLDTPRYLVFDLDPHPSQPFTTVVGVALLLKEALASFGLTGYPKTSGSTGLHIFVPLKPGYDYATVRRCAVTIAQFVARVDSRVTLARPLRARGRRLYLDCWQIGFGKTLVGVYSPRPLKGAPVSTPLAWPEVTPALRPEDFHLKNIPDRLAQTGDLFQPVLTTENDLTAVLRIEPAG